MGKDTLGSLELLIAAAIVHRPKGSYGLEIADRIRDQTGRDISIGALYTTLERLEQKGFVSSRWGESTPQRGGRRKRYYRLEAQGARVLSDMQKGISKLASPALAGASR